MTNHVHFLGVPEKEDSLAKAVGKAHRQCKWSSAGYHCGEISYDPLVKKSPLFSDIKDWKAFLSSTYQHAPVLEEKIRTGQPFGPDNFYSIIENITGWNPRPGLLGRPKKK